MIILDILWHTSWFILGFIAGVLLETAHHNRIKKISDKERIARYEERIDCLEKKIRERQEND